MHLADPESDLAAEIASGKHYMSVAECNQFYAELNAPNEVDPIDMTAISYIKSQEEAD